MQFMHNINLLSVKWLYNNMVFLKSTILHAVLLPAISLLHYPTFNTVTRLGVIVAYHHNLGGRELDPLCKCT